MLSIFAWSQSPVPPPISTNFNNGIPADWTIETAGSVGWTLHNSMGFGGSPGLMMDCSGCSFAEETTIWSPWLDLSSYATIQIEFKCAIIAGGFGIAPPFILRRDYYFGAEYYRVYGEATLIPPPDEVIPSTIDVSPPLDPSNVTWVSVTHTYSTGLANDSVRFGFNSWPPFDGYALVDDIVIGAGIAAVQVSPQVMLGGPYDDNTGQMIDQLRMDGSLPNVEPYTHLGYSFIDGGGESVSNSLLNNTGNDAIVDWVILELRSALDPSIVVSSQSALLQRDGDVVNVNGNPAITFPRPPGSYHVAIRHRNHLGCMNASPVSLSGSSTIVDFSSPGTATYGINARKDVSGTLVLWSGDVTFDGEIKYTGLNNDRDPILVAIGGVVPTNQVSGYLPEDVNLDGVVKYTGAANDRDIILQSIGGIVPTNTRLEQLP